MANPHVIHYPLQLGSRMLPTDALFWYVEDATPELRPLVAGLLLLDRPPDHERLRASVERWVARLPRLRQRVVEAPLHLGLPEWEDDPHFELEYHAREVVLPEPATERHLLDFAGAVFATPLDRMRPLWEAYLIEGLEDGRAACFFKVHHSVMDGVGSLAVFDAMTQAHRAEPVRVPRYVPAARRLVPPGDGFRRLARDALDNAVGALGAAATVSAGAVLRPGELLGDLARAGRGVRGMLADLTATAIDDPLARESTGIGRRLDAMTLSVKRLRRIGEGLGATLNDVVLTALSGAVGRYHEHRKMHVQQLNCMVPMNLRPDDQRHTLGNRVGAFTVALPVGEPDPLVRLARIQRQTGAAKRDRRAASFPLVIRALAFMPGFVYRLFAQSITGRVNLICTNVPGPPTQRYLAGARVEAIYPFAPVALGTPLSMALLSYGDTYGIGIASDPAAIPDPELLGRYLAAAFDEIEAEALPRTARGEPAQRAAAGRGRSRPSGRLAAASPAARARARHRR